MITTLQVGGKTYTVRIASSAPLLCLPKAKTPRSVEDWAEHDGLEYDLSEPIWLEPMEVTLQLNGVYVPKAGDTPILKAFGRDLAIEVRYATAHTPFEGWTEVKATLADMTPLFGSGAISQASFSADDLASRGILVAPDWDSLKREPERKRAFELSSKSDNGSESPLANGRKERTITMEVWSRGVDCVSQHLDFCARLRSQVEGKWLLRGASYFFRYQQMELISYLPKSLVATKVTLQQYRY